MGAVLSTAAPEDQPDSGIAPDLLDAAHAQAARDGVPVMRSLQVLGGWTNEELMRALSMAFCYPTASMEQLQALAPMFERISYPECVARGVVLAIDAAAQAHLVLSDPFDGENEAWALRRHGRGSGMPRIVLVHPEILQAYLVQQERQLRAMDGFSHAIDASNMEEVAAVITLASIAAEASPVVKLVDSTIYDALKLRASDIHLECDAGTLSVLYRIDGVLVPITLVNDEVAAGGIAEQVVSRVKVMAELDIAERRVPQDGRFKVRVQGREIDFRVSVMPNIFGEDAVLRLLDRQALTEEAQALRLDNLGLDPLAIRHIRRLAAKPHGMLLVTGPTGSGKTTTLYAAITEIHTGSDKIVTIEDPVEYRLPRVLQIPVNEKKGLTFARGLRSILRHDPDKIMVGEIRDDETAQIAVQAALTGHLVFTTVHANNVFDVLGRFLHMGVDAYSFAAALNGIVAQRLIRISCGHCVADMLPDDDLLEAAGLSRGETNGWRFRAGTGCGHCRGTGYRGRKAIAEVLVLDETLRELIASRAPVAELRRQALQRGLVALRDLALQSVARGETTLQEVVRVEG